MQFERIKKSHKRKIIIGGLILVCVISGVTITTTRAKYKLTQDIPLVRGNINYKSYDFKIMAMYQSEDKVNYTEINAMPSSGYVINEEKTYCTTDNKTQVKGKIKTVNGIHGLYNITKSDKCYLYFDKYVPQTMDNIIAILNPKDTTPDFSKVAESDEGVYKVSDGMYGGISYYWRGAATTNYVKFAGFCWRIIRINGDKTMRLIYDGTTCHQNGEITTDSIAKTGQAYNSNYNRSEYVGWTYSQGTQRTTNGTASNIKTQTENWFTANITGTNLAKVADGKFCNDRNTQSGYSWSSTPSSTLYFAARGRLESAKTPTLSCPSGDMYTLKVGAITADEVAYAGGIWERVNHKYYLNNGHHYWTMSPHCLSLDMGERYAGMILVYDSGFLTETGGYLGSSENGIRPVINLKSDITFTGNGTLSNPYVVE